MARRNNRMPVTQHRVRRNRVHGTTRERRTAPLHAKKKPMDMVEYGPVHYLDDLIDAKFGSAAAA